MVIRPRATASRVVTGLSPTSTIRTAPRGRRARDGASRFGCPSRDDSRALAIQSPCARKNDRLSSDTVRSTLFSFTSGGHLQRTGGKVQHRFDARLHDRVDDRLRRFGRHGNDGDADVLAPDDAAELADVVDRNAGTGAVADLSRIVSNSAAI